MTVAFVCVFLLLLYSLVQNTYNGMGAFFCETKRLTYVQKCMQWRKWRKIASRWRFELDAKSDPLEAGDFGENGYFGDFGKNRQRAGENSHKRPRPLETSNFGENGDCSEIGNFGKNRQKCMQWRKWQKITSLWRFELDAKSGPLEAGDFGEIGDFGKNRQRAGDMWQNIQIGCQKWPLQSRQLKKSL